MPGPGSREGAAAAFPGTTELPERQKTSPTCVGELHSTIREVTMDFFFSGIQLHFTPGRYFHSLATNHLYFFMILHCFEQIMQFRYFVPAAAYSKDKYRLLFRESRVPAFFSRFIAGGESDAGISIRGNLREAVTNSPGTFLLLRAGTARLQQGHFLALRAQGATPCGAMRKTPMCRRMAHGGLKTFRRTGLPFSFAGALLRRRPRGTRGRLTDGSRP